MRTSRKIVLALTGAAVVAATATTAVAATPGGASTANSGSAHGRWHWGDHYPVSVHIITPRPGTAAGIDGKAWIVDLKIDYPSAAAAGFTAPQLTGPGAHANTAPYPGSFSPGQDDRLPGLIVLDSGTSSTLPGFSGSGTNLANLFNVTSIVDQRTHETQIQDTWIVGAPIAGTGVDTTLTVAVAADRNHNGVYDDAPAVVPDANHDGVVNAQDLRAYGVASPIETVRFHINGASS